MNEQTLLILVLFHFSPNFKLEDRIREFVFTTHVVQPMSELTTKLPYRKPQYPTYVKDIELDVHIKVFKKAIKVNGEIVESDIINMYGFTLQSNIFEWEENYVQDHLNCTFDELEQAFCK